MKKLITLCAAVATTMSLCAANGDVTDGWLMVENFESSTVGSTVSVWNSKGAPAVGAATIVKNPTAPTEKSANFIGGDYNTIIELSVTLPAGKTLSNYSKVSFDLYRNSGDGNYKKMRVQANGDILYYDTAYVEQAKTATWTTKTYAIPDTVTIGNSFKLRIGIESNAADYIIDNVKLKVSDGSKPGTSSNGTVSGGWLMAEDFEATAIGSDVAIWNKLNQKAEGTATIMANPTYPNERVASFVGGDYNTVIDLKITLPTGKTLKDYSNVSFDIYRNSGDANYKKMLVQADTYVINEDADYIQQAAAVTWTTKSYPISSTNTVGNSFNLRIGIESNAADYLIDNVKLKVIVPTGIEVNEVSDVQKNDNYYNLNGMYVKNPTKGIYIHNGKKITIK